MAELEITHPATGEVIDRSSIDDLVRNYRAASNFSKSVTFFKTQLAFALWELTKGKNKTRHLRGQQEACTLTAPSDSFDQSILKEIWNSYPQYRDEFLRLAEIKVNLAPFQKLEKTESDDPAFNTFKAMLLKAYKGTPGTPRVTVKGESTDGDDRD